jgi:RNA polymerase sigma-70 factor (ECF subfamily)
MMSGSTDLVEDLAQEIWVAIFRGLPTLLDVTKFRPLGISDRAAIASIANSAAASCRWTRWMKWTWQSFADTADPHSVVEPEELRHCLAALSPGHREVLMLRFFEEMDYEEIARITGSTLGTVRSRIHYAKRALRRAYEEQTL